MRIGTIEMQMKATAFIQSRLARFVARPFCPPPAQNGLQVQRIEVSSATILRSKPATFTTWYVDRRNPQADDRGLLPTPNQAQGFQAQIALDIQLWVVPSLEIQLSPNQLVFPTDPVESALRPVVILDLDCYSLDGLMYVRMPISEVQLPEDRIPAVLLNLGRTPEEIRAVVRDQIGNFLGSKAEIVDIKGLMPSGTGFVNAGLAVDSTGSRIALRGETAPGNSSNDQRWTTFHRGFFQDYLGEHDWGIVIGAEDMKLMLINAVQGAAGDALSDITVISVDCLYSAQPGKAVFTVRVHATVDDLNDKFVVLPIVLSLQESGGEVAVELNLHELQEAIDDLRDFVSVLIWVFTPPIVNAAVYLIADSMFDEIDQKISQFTPGSIIPGVNLVADATDPLVLRGTVSFPVPSMIRGRVDAITTTPDGFAVVGASTPLRYTPSNLNITQNNFAWIAPQISCSSASRAVLQDMREDPKRFASLYAAIELGMDGSSPIRVCGATIINVPMKKGNRPDGSSFDIPLASVSITSESVPARVEVSALPDLAELNPPVQLAVEVRTTKGVFNALVPPPPALTPQVVDFLVGTLEVQLRNCERVVGPWYKHRGAFDMNWIENPLVDPRDDFYGLVTVNVRAPRLKGGMLDLLDLKGAKVASTSMSASGAATLAHLQTAAVPAALRLSPLSDSGESLTKASEDLPDVVVTRQRLTPIGKLALPMFATRIDACGPAGTRRFAVTGQDHCILVAADEGSRPSLIGNWALPGLRGVIWTKAGLVGFGDAGMYLLSADRRAVEEFRLGAEREAVVGVTRVSDLIAIAFHNRVVLCNQYLSVIETVRNERPVTRVATLGGRLVVATEHTAALYSLAGRTPRLLSEYRASDAIADFVSRAPAVLLKTAKQSWVGLKAFGDNLVAVDEWAAEPWQASSVLSGGLLAACWSRKFVDVYRVESPVMAVPRDPATTTESV